MRLKAHDNVFSLAERRRVREEQQAAEMGVPPGGVMFVGFQMKQSSEMLTPSEIQSLRQRAKENSAFYRKAFANLTLENGKVVEKIPAEPAPEPPRRKPWWRRWDRWRKR
jgi:hypothetical protein